MMISIRIFWTCCMMASVLVACGGAQSPVAISDGMAVHSVSFTRPFSASGDVTPSAKSLTVQLTVHHTTSRVELWVVSDQQTPVTPVTHSKVVTIGENELNLMLADENEVPLTAGRYTLIMKAYTMDGRIHSNISCPFDYLGPEPHNQPAVQCY